MAGTRKGCYRITNWAKYNTALVGRGSITFWFDEEVLASWRHANEVVRRGHPFVYSDRAIECLLALRELFRLPYRQTEGLGKSLAELMQVEVEIPDYTSLAKRAGKLRIDLAATPSQGPIDVVVDSTGLKVFGEGEWKMRQHGKTKRRTWRKLHLVINPQTQTIEAEVLTENSGHDADQVPSLLQQVTGRIKTFRGDGAYDKWKVYQELAARQITPLIPPQHNAKIKHHGNAASPPLPRDETIRRIRKVGRQAWKEQVGYHVRSLIETTMYRLKTIFGNCLKNRQLSTQHTEIRLRCKIFNHFTQSGMPAFKWN
jgi:IS5 family transposase